MIPILYARTETDFLTNGLGRMTEATSCIVTEERNGIYELSMVYPVTGACFEYLDAEQIILARHSDSVKPQPFRIYRISRPLSGLVTISARHISYDLTDIPMMPFTATGINATFEAIPDNTAIPCPFTFWTDKNTANVYELTAPASVRAMLGGVEGSILDVFGGGDYEFDTFAVKLHAHRGSDNGVSIRYGKNLTDITRQTDADGIFDAVVPFYRDDATGEVLTLPEKILAIDSANIERAKALDLSDRWESVPTVEQLRTKAQEYLTNSDKTAPAETLKVSFVALWQTEEYKDFAPLQRVELCDTVHVYYAALGVNASMRVIRTVYDCLLERYDTIELGTASYTMSDAVKSISTETAQAAGRQAAQQASSAAQSMIDSQTALITGQTGGYFVLDTDASGKPVGWLIMDTPDKTTARNVIRANASGIGFSQNGYSGPYTTAWTIDSKFNADYISTGILTDDAGKFSLNMTTGALTMQDGTFTGTVNAEAGVIGGFTVDDEKMLYGTPGQAGAVMVWPDGNGPGLNYGNIHSAGNTTQYVFGIGESGQAGGLGIAADGTIDGTNIRASQIIEIQEQDVEYCAMTWEGFEVYDPTTLAVASYLHKDGAKVSGPVEISGALTGSASESVSATYNGLTITLRKNAGAVTAYIRGTLTADLATSAGYVDLITPADASWMPAAQMVGYQLLNNAPWRGQVAVTPTMVRLGYTRNSSGTAADLPTGTTIYAFVTWAAK